MELGIGSLIEGLVAAFADSAVDTILSGIGKEKEDRLGIV